MFGSRFVRVSKIQKKSCTTKNEDAARRMVAAGRQRAVMPHVGNVAHGGHAEVAVALAVLDDGAVHGSIAAVGDEHLGVGQLVAPVPHHAPVSHHWRHL